MRANSPAKVRCSERGPAAVPISLVQGADGFRVDYSATTIDISLHGMKIRTALTLVPGEWVGVVARGDSPHAIPSRVVWVRVEDPGLWTQVGVEFLPALPA